MKKVCLTCDLWLSVANVHFLIVTYHWINKDWCVKNLILEIIDVESKEDAEAILVFIKKKRYLSII